MRRISSWLIELAGLSTDDKKQKAIRHTLRHTAITWYFDQGVDIEKVSLYSGVSVATIRKTYRHLVPGTFDTCSMPRTNLGVEYGAQFG